MSSERTEEKKEVRRLSEQAGNDENRGGKQKQDMHANLLRDNLLLYWLISLLFIDNGSSSCDMIFALAFHARTPNTACKSSHRRRLG
jgi:hypothetical protein